MRRFPELDGLRAALALGVVFVHLKIPGMYWMVVMMDGFFGLSAFVITIGLLDKGTISRIQLLRSFYWRRMVRICPPYYALLIAVAAMMWLINMAAPRIGLAGTFSLESLAPYVVYLQFTERFWHHDEATAYLHAVRFLRHTWSLAVEEQFYLIWGGLFCLAQRNWLRVAVACGFVGIGILARLSGEVESPLITYRIDSFGYGILFALWYHHRATHDGFQPRRYALPLALLSALAFASYWWVAQIPNLYWNWLSQAIPLPHFEWSPASALTSAGCATLVIALACGSGARAILFLRSDVFLYLGRISYCLYLVHYPVIDVLLRYDVKLLHAGAIGDCAAVLVLSLGLAHLLTLASERLGARLIGAHRGRRQSQAFDDGSAAQAE